MSEQENYILNNLCNEYHEDQVFRDTETTKIASYIHNSTGNKLVVIKSNNQNDIVFRKLKGKKCSALPMIFDVCCGEDTIIILEEFVSGKTLSQMLTDGLLSKEDAIKYCLDICEALEFLHKENIVHRDIKPSNIVITEKNSAVLIDLQSARLMSGERDRDTQNLGTVGYAAPEQYGITQSVPATDIYALGVVLNEILTGEHPSVKVPRGKIGSVIKKCTNTQISKRYKSVSKLKKEIKISKFL